MKVFNKGDVVKCHAVYAKNHPSEWTGKFVMIIECLSENDPFIGKIDSEFLNLVRKTNVDYNLHLAKDVVYKVLSGKRIIYMNHLCFVESSKFLDWEVAFDLSAFNY